jgi:hypothetical protein
MGILAGWNRICSYRKAGEGKKWLIHPPKQVEKEAIDNLLISPRRRRKNF